MKILDACCGTRMFWLQKHNADVTYIDIRPEVGPDIVMDCRYTSFPDSTFDLIFFDPPHRKLGPTAILAHKYGSVLPSEARRLVRDAFVEFDRILKPGGLRPGVVQVERLGDTGHGKGTGQVHTFDGPEPK